MIALRLLLNLCVLLVLAAAMPAHAQSRNATEIAFQKWLSETVTPAAEKRGVTASTLQRAFAGLKLDWTLPDLAPPGQPGREEPQRQAEFQGPARYFDEGKVKSLAQGGRSRFKTWSRTLAEVETRYGVSPSIVLAIWGRESGYGAAKLPYSAIRALATESFMGARKENFYPELLAALEILEGDHIALNQMKSSWAGALGQPQFLPSKYLTTAVDFDKNGRRDIWNSVPDTLGSIANYLKQNGWQPGVGWGFEVALPPEIACSLEGPDQGKPMSDWLAMGIRNADGSQINARTPKQIMHLLMPAGRYGPAFLVSDNFYVLKSYNESDLYALFIGHLADRIRSNAGPFLGRWADVGGFRRSDVRSMQQRLEARGVDVGSADGLVGYKTRIAVGDWQTSKGVPPTCFPDAALLKQIR
ncbi:lytic murein transglycosylase [Mesorhizobium sp. BR1-1-16]|uniref:lytic murein transglycosylase n=1 Tax=Mesorhizobium sp. BR1-1-16 TaxID=2876653 RepID=UPI00336A68E1